MTYNCERCQILVEQKFGSGRFCSRACANAKTWTPEDKLKKSNAAKSSAAVTEANRQERNRYSVPKIVYTCQTCKTEFTDYANKNKVFCSKNCHQIAIKLNKDNLYGGLRLGSGRGKNGWYKGYWCDSSWELAWVMYHLDHNILFARNTQKFSYVFKNKLHNYIPDFIVKDTYVEVKGYMTMQVEAKIAAFPHKLVVLDKPKMLPYIKYAQSKYGTNYTVLYEQ